MAKVTSYANPQRQVWEREVICNVQRKDLPEECVADVTFRGKEKDRDRTGRST